MCSLDQSTYNTISFSVNFKNYITNGVHIIQIWQHSLKQQQPIINIFIGSYYYAFFPMRIPKIRGLQIQLKNLETFRGEIRLKITRILDSCKNDPKTNVNISENVYSL